ncbi:hypothetical protein V8E53_012300 [Lactarius tabidus]
MSLLIAARMFTQLLCALARIAWALGPKSALFGLSRPLSTLSHSLSVSDAHSSPRALLHPLILFLDSSTHSEVIGRCINPIIRHVATQESSPRRTCPASLSSSHHRSTFLSLRIWLISLVSTPVTFAYATVVFVPP